MRIWVFALAAMLAAATPAVAQVASFEDVEIAVGAPDNYCDIEGPSGVMQRLVFSDDPGDILIAFAPCEEVDAVAAGTADTFHHYGLIVGLRDGEGEAIRPESLETYLLEYDSEQFDVMAMGSRQAAVGLNSDLPVEIQPIGPVSSREQAHYVAMTIRPMEAGRPAMVAVAGRTVIAGRVVQVELYAPEDEAPIPLLIELGQDVVGLLWEANGAAAGVGAAELQARRAQDEAEGAGESGADEEEEYVAPEDVAEPAEDEALAAAAAMTEEFVAALRAIHWIAFGYFGASIALGLAIFGYLKLQPRNG